MQAGKNQYILAERLFNDQKYQASIDEFRKVVDEDPKRPVSQQALFRIATIQYLYLNQYDEAIRSFKQFTLFSRNNELLFQAEKNIAEIYFSKLEHYKQSLELYKKLYEKYPSSDEADFFLFRVAKSNYGLLLFQDAMAAYRELAEKFPQSSFSVEARYQIGNTFFTMGNCLEAVKKLRDFLKQYSTSVQAGSAEFSIAQCLEEDRQFEEAKKLYEKLLPVYPVRKVIEEKLARMNLKTNVKTNSNAKAKGI